MKAPSKERILSGALLLLLFFIGRELPFFWDSHIHSLHAQSFQFWAPPEGDFGHPPLFNFLLMFTWLPFGPQLWSAHLLALALVGATLYTASKLQTFQKAPLFLLFLEPLFLAQSLQISADLLLALCYLLSLLFLEKRRKVAFSITLCLLAMTSLRGILLLPALGLTLIFTHKDWKNWLLSFLPVVTLSLLWFYFHHLHSGWVFTPPNAGSHRSFQTPRGMVKNAVVFTWYLLDYGRISVLVGLFYLFSRRPSKAKLHSALQAIFPLVIIAGFSLPLTNPFGERYLLVPILLFLGLWWNWSEELPKTKRTLLRLFTTILLLLGNLMVYPAKIAQNWDSSPGHVILLEQQKQFEQDFSNLGAQEKVFSFYPQTIPRRATHLKEDFKYFAPSSCEGTLSHFFYSPLQNGLTDATIAKLETHSNVEKEYTFLLWKSKWLKEVPCTYF